MLGAGFGGTVAPIESVLKIKGQFRNHGLTVLFSSGNLDGCDQVLLAIGTQGTYRQLTTGKDHRFLQVLQHEAQCRSGISHGVGAMQHDKPVVTLIMLLYDSGHSHPELRFDIGRVNQWREGDRVYTASKTPELGHLILNM